MQHWQVVHTLDRPITVVKEVASYVDRGIDFTYEAGKLVQIRHSFSVKDGLGRLAAVETSRNVLSLIVDLIEFWWGNPVRIVESIPQLLSETTDDPGAVLHGAVVAGMSVTVARAVRLPSPEALRSAPSRLHVWLRLANEAARATSVEAVRNYYMIWEDMHAPDPPKAGEPLRLKLIRDFVSHGKNLTNPDLLALLQQEFGRPVSQFDPLDPAHRELIDDERVRARQLMEAELSSLLIPTQ
jgi:hypothetical protein